MPLAALAYTYCSEADVQAILGVDAETGRLDDQDAGFVGPDNAAWLPAAINWATAKVNQYCLARYPALALSQSWIVNQWCTVLACHGLCIRRGNPVPTSLESLYGEVLEDLKLVVAGTAQIADAGQRDAAWPAWSNMRVDQLYNLRKVRTERPISEGAANLNNRDVAADYVFDWI